MTLTEFEQQVAEALFNFLRRWPMGDVYTGPSEQFLNRLAPRVAAAIERAVGQARVPLSQEQTDPAWREAALNALKGAVDAAPLEHNFLRPGNLCPDHGEPLMLLCAQCKVSMAPVLDLEAIERDLHQTWANDDGLRVLYDHAVALLASVRVDRELLLKIRRALGRLGISPVHVRPSWAADAVGDVLLGIRLDIEATLSTHDE